MRQIGLLEGGGPLYIHQNTLSLYSGGCLRPTQQGTHIVQHLASAGCQTSLTSSSQPASSVY